MSISHNTRKASSNQTESSFFDIPGYSQPFWTEVESEDFSRNPLILHNKFHIRNERSFEGWDSCTLSLQNSLLIFRKVFIDKKFFKLDRREKKH